MAKNKSRKKIKRKKSPKRKKKTFRPVLKPKIRPKKVRRKEAKGKRAKPRPLSLKKKRAKKVKKNSIPPKPVLKKNSKNLPKKSLRPKKTVKIGKKKQAESLFDGIHKTKIRVVGIGGGGSTIVSEIASRIKKADFYIANTDSRALRNSAGGVKRFQFGQELTRGLGTGTNAELGESAALAEEEKIKKILEGQDLCIFIASLGGGTSSGASPVFAKISKSLGNITYGIFTLPFAFEGEKKMETAWEALEKIRPHLNVYTVIPNERIFQIIDKNTPLNDALSAINRRLSDSLEGLIEMIYLPGLINIDFADLRTILAGRGRLTYLDTIEVQGPNKDEAIKKLISSPIYPYNIKGSRGILYNIISGKDIQLSEVYQISNLISESVSKKAKIIFGINQSPKYKDRIKITLLAVGCGAKGSFPLSKKTEKPAGKKEKKRGKEKLSKEAVGPAAKTESKAKKRKISSNKSSPKRRKPSKKKGKIKNQARALISKSPSSLSVQPETANPLPASTVQFGELVGKVRKNALQVRREAEEAEKEILEQEKVWEIPAILRRKKE